MWNSTKLIICQPILRNLKSIINRAKEDIKNTLNATGLRTRTQQEIKKELLDAEMELFNSEQNQSHDQTKELQEKV